MDVGTAPGGLPFGALRRRASRAQEAGFRSLWWGDHLLAFQSSELWSASPVSRTRPDPHAHPDAFVCMAVAADAAPETVVGVCVTDAIRRMPASLAQTALTLDHLAPGRVVLGVGAGEALNYRPYGWHVPSPAARLEQAAAEIRRYFDEGTADEKGAVVGLRPPLGSPGPQLWIAAHGPRSFAAAGRFGDGWVPHLLARDAWGDGRQQVRAAAVAEGRDPDALVMALSASVVIQEDHQAAHRLLEHPVLKAYTLILPPARFRAAGIEHPLGQSGLETLMPTLRGDEARRAAEAVPFDVVHEHFLHGTVDDVVAKALRYPGLDHLLMWDASALADLAAAPASAAGCAEVARRLGTDRRAS